MTRLVIAAWTVVALVTWTSSATQGDEGEPPLSVDQIQFFESKIRPALIEHCYRCHSADGSSIRGGLAVDSRDGLLAGGESGSAIVPENLDESLLWNAITYQDLRMPPGGRMPQTVIDDFKTWIEMGAPDPRARTGVVIHSKVTAEDIEQGKQFWSFRPPVQKDIPESAGLDWADSTIDRWVADGWREAGTIPAADCEPESLVRRLTFDLVGLPPTPLQQQAFLTTSKRDIDKAIADLVDELLEQPQFGERWGRHWLDIARYAESSGKESDSTFPHAWRYRNYVIRSFNQDKPYNRFVMEQVAGDLLPAADDAQWNEHLIATGFLALGPKSLTEQNPRQFQADLVDEQVDTLSRVVLGVSVGCARCHDHKFDPIPQSDYYAMAGIFQSTQTLYGGSRSLRNRQPSDLIALPSADRDSAQKPLTRTELDALRQELKEREAQLVEARRAQRAGTRPEGTPTSNGNPRAANPVLNAALLDQLISQLNARIQSVDGQGKPISFCMGVQDASQARNARLLVRGEIEQPAQEVPRGFLQVLTNAPVSLPKNGSGRLELARWLASSDNPLTARVMVNRIWQHLIGQGIVREPDNFGASGPSPTHPELLDHLAIEFMENGWSIKRMVRSIVQSRVYRLASTYDEQRFNADPENRALARGNAKRLDAEAIRDAMLSVSGQLEMSPPKASLIASFGSAPIGPNGPMTLPPGLISALNSTKSTAGTTDDGASMMRSAMRTGGRNPNVNVFEIVNYHRSVYLPIARNSLPRVLDAFDFAEPSLVVGVRETSNTAEQALYMLNNPFVLEMSDSLARRLVQHTQDPRERVVQAFRLVYGREPTSHEMAAVQQFFRKATGETKANKREELVFLLLSQLCQSLFSSAEFRILN